MTSTTSSNAPTALIVGGSSGIGLATAHRLLLANVNLIIVGSSAEKLSAANDLLAKAALTVKNKPSVQTWQYNLNNDACCKKLVARVAELDDSVDLRYLVNAAGVYKPKPFVDATEEDYEVCSQLSLSLLTRPYSLHPQHL